MLPAKNQPNRPNGSWKEVIYGHGGHLELPIITYFE